MNPISRLYRMRRGGLTLGAVALIVLALAPSAQARTTVSYDRLSGLLVVADPGEGERLRVRSNLEVGNLYVATQAGAPRLRAGSGCTLLNDDLPDSEVQCSASGVRIVTVDLKDGSDSLVYTSAEATEPCFCQGGAGNDVITTGAGADSIQGGAGDDVLKGLAGNDVLNGDAGAETFGGPAETGNDRYSGGDGADVFQASADPGNDIFAGGPGADLATYDKVATPVSVTADNVANDGPAGQGDDVRSDVEGLTGGSANDTLVGSSIDNRLEGFLGVDTLQGGGGNDTFLLRDGFRDKCVVPNFGDTQFVDLVDPTPRECLFQVNPTFAGLQPSSFTFNSQPVDETIPHTVIGKTLRRHGAGRLSVTVRCVREAKRTCKGTLKVASAKGGRTLARKRYSVRPRRTSRVLLSPGAANVRRLHAAGRAQLTTTARGSSRKGLTSTLVLRRL